MMGKTLNNSTNTNEPKDTRSRRAGSSAPMRPEITALIQGLDRFRDGLYQRLDEIETLAIEQTQWLEQDLSEREQTLQDRVATLEAAQSRLLAEAKRKEQEWQNVLQQLESDRRLLAEAWERLEQEQLDLPQAPVTPHAHVSVTPTVERPPVQRPVTDSSDDVVTRQILKQFQALKSDVRRNAKGRSGP